MKKAEIKELTDMVMNAKCERTKHNDGFILTCKNNEGFSGSLLVPSYHILKVIIYSPRLRHT